VAQQPADNRCMVDLILIAHAPMATALSEVARHVFSDVPQRVYAIDVQPQEGLDELERRLRVIVSARPSGERLIMVDVFGATPYNAAQRLSDLSGTRLLAGVNIPMLWRALSYQHLPLDQLVERAHMGAVQGVILAASSRPQNPTPAAGHDPTQHHHHQ
jgi:mannose PTS system EIIA component